MSLGRGLSLGLAVLLLAAGARTARAADDQVPECGSGAHKGPPWARQPAADEFIGVSSLQPDERAARAAGLADARRQVVEYLGVSVEATFLDQVSLDTRGGEAREEVQLSETTRTLARAVVQVREELVHVFHCREGQDSRWQAWVLVRFDREAHHRFVERWVAETERVARDLVGRSEDAGDAQPAVALDCLLRAGQAAVGLARLGSLPPDLSGRVQALTSDVGGRTGRLLATWSLVAGGADQVGAEGRGLPAPLTLTVRTRLGDPVVGLPVTFRFSRGQGELTGETRTDARGVAACPVARLDPGSAEWAVEASLVEPAMARQLSLQPPKVAFAIRAGKGRLLVVTAWAGWKPPHAVQAGLVRALEEALAGRGLDVLDAAALAGVQAARAGEDGYVRELARQAGASGWLRVAVQVEAPRPGPLGEDSRVVSVTLQLSLRDTSSGEQRFLRGLPDVAVPDLRGFGLGPDAEAAALADALGARTLKLYPRLVNELADGIAK
jgi:hypothetical protein